MRSTLPLILLECDANFPSELTCINLHPMVVYIQIARQRVRVWGEGGGRRGEGGGRRGRGRGRREEGER